MKVLPNDTGRAVLIQGHFGDYSHLAPNPVFKMWIIIGAEKLAIYIGWRAPMIL
jgi:hypothetical protein